MNSLLSILMFMTAVLLTPVADAQKVTDFANTRNTLTAQQTKALDAFVSAGAKGLAGDDPVEVMEARDEFVDLLTRHGATPVFRDAFFKSFETSIRDAMANAGVFNQYNIYRVLAYVRTADSNELLASQLSPSSNPNPADRIFASNMLNISLHGTDPSIVRPRQYTSIIRSILTGAEEETDWIALQHEFESLVAIAGNNKVPVDTRSAAIEAQATLLKSILGQLETSKNAEGLARAISSIVLMMRTEFIGLDGAARRDFKTKITGSLAATVGAGKRAWSTLHSDPKARAAYGNALQQATVLARLIVGESGAPSTDPADAWKSGKESDYDAAAAPWANFR